MKESTEVNEVRAGDRGTVQAAAEVLAGDSKKGRLASLLPFLGPAFIASVAYVDPGNFATNIQGGAQFGYILLWVIVASNLMAMLLQTLSAKLGIATGQNLAELCRANFPRPVVISMWVLMEIVAMATDLAEFLGAALGFNLLFGIPLWVAGLLTAVVTFLILGLERYGFRPIEAVITALIGVVAVSYIIETDDGSPRSGAGRSSIRWCPSSRGRRASCWRRASWARPSCRTPSSCTPPSPRTGSWSANRPCCAACSASR